MRRCVREVLPVVAIALALSVVVPSGLATPEAAGDCVEASQETASYRCDGIRPGVRMTSPAGCTMNFVFTDGTDLYMGTAGHCVSGVGDRVRIAGEGTVGTVVVEELDWALVRLDDDLHDRVDPQMCYWGGPTDLVTGDPGPGTLLKQYGHGILLGWTSPTRPRGGVATKWTEWTVDYNGPQVWGDSGSPVITADGGAAGSVSSIGPSLNGGLLTAQRISKGIEVSEQALGTDLSLVTAPLADVP